MFGFFAIIFGAANKTKVTTKETVMAVCSTVLPQVHADLCDDQAFYGEVSQFYFTRLGDDLTLYTDDAEWATRLSNTTALPASPALAPIRQLFGIGSISDPERPAIKLSRKRTKYGSAKFTLVFNVDDTGATNWTFLQTIPAGGQVYACWFGTEERLFGGNSGIEATVVADYNIPESADELMKIKLTVTWETTIPPVQDNFLS